jgi:hypothetical protein
MSDHAGVLFRRQWTRRDHGPELAEQVFWRFTLDYESSIGSVRVIRQWPEVLRDKYESPSEVSEAAVTVLRI